MLHSLLGLLGLTALAWAFSENRRAVPWRVVGAGLVAQLAGAWLLINLPGVKLAFLWLNRAVDGVQEATLAGTAFVFGFLGGGPAPFAIAYPQSNFVLAFQALPMVLVISALSALLFHWRVLPWVVRGFAWALRRGLGVGGAVGVAAASSIFLGMVEAPLLIRPYIGRLTRSELFVVMAAGMATIAGTMMVIYATILKNVIPDPVGHILIASLISAPSAIMVARLMVPEKDTSVDDGRPPELHRASSSMEAVVQGTADGLGLLFNIVALLVVLVALVSLANQILALLPAVDGAPVTLQRLFGLVMAPLVWLMGIPWAEAGAAGALMGTKTVLNEFLAYMDLARLPPEALSPRSKLIMTYALCGFANFGSLGIMIGGLTTMAPERRHDILGLGLKSIVAGTIATCITGAVVGVVG